MNIKKNFFLTGEKKVGKSTLLNRILEENSFLVAGFKTLPHFSGGESDGFYFHSMLNHEADFSSSLICRKISHKTCVPITETFENAGVEILKTSLEAIPHIILMDELGILESQAHNFQRHVKLCLDSTITVLGVLKQADVDFLNSIRDREDVVVMEVTRSNREEVLDHLKRQLLERVKRN